MMNNVLIDGVEIGLGCKPYIVAELSANHNGSIERAKETMLLAKKNGADAIKLQTYTADTMTIDEGGDEFMVRGGLWDGYKLYDLYQWAETPYEWHEELFRYAKEIDITCFSTPFDETAVDLLETLNTPAYKIASFEAIDLPLIRYVAKTGKPMIISTGMASFTEIEEAVDAARVGGCKDLILLHCVSSYPAPAEQSNLATIQDLSDRFDVVSGLSDHSLGTEISVASIALGASFIEKHFTINRSDKGPDSEFSIEPDELKKLCSDSETVWSAIGKAGYERKDSEKANLNFRRSIYFVNEIKSGNAISEQDIRRIRPGFGLAPKYFDELIGKRVNRDIVRGTAATWDLIDD